MEITFLWRLPIARIRGYARHHIIMTAWIVGREEENGSGSLSTPLNYLLARASTVPAVLWVESTASLLR